MSHEKHMQKHQRVFTLSLLVVILVTAGFGCKGLTAEQKAAVKPVSLNYWTTYNDLSELEKFATAYKKKRPYVTINIEQVRSDEFEKRLTNALADDVAPNIISVNVRDLRAYTSRLLAMPEKITATKIYVKGEYVKETIVEKETVNMPTINTIKNSFITTVYNDAVVGGQVYGLPLAVDTLAIYYNKDLLDQAGIPEPPKTWDEFMKAVKASTRFNDKGDIIQSGVPLGTGKNVPYAFDILSLLMMQSGVKMSYGSSVNFDNGVDEAGINHPSLAATRFYTDFAQPTKEVYTWNEKLGDGFEAFASGRTVFYFGYAFDYPRIKARAPQLNVEIMPMLQLNEKQPVNIANYWVESVVKKSKNQNEAWEFVAFMAAPANIKQYTTATHRPTPLRAQIAEQKEDVTMAPFAVQVLNAENWYRGQNSAKAAEAFNYLINGFLQPAGDKNEAQRERDLINYTAQLVRQTM